MRLTRNEDSCLRKDKLPTYGDAEMLPGQVRAAAKVSDARELSDSCTGCVYAHGTGKRDGLVLYAS